MPDDRNLNHRIDSRLLTPLLLMAVAIVCGFLCFAYLAPAAA